MRQLQKLESLTRFRVQYTGIKQKTDKNALGFFFGKKLHSRAANLFVRAQYRLNDV